MIFITHAFDEIGSTNDEAAARARAGAPEGTFVVARTQTAGRGRQSRYWHSRAGNLYCSLLLRPLAPIARFGEISFIAALAAGETVGHFGADWALKWPNDVLVNGKKIAGLLLESEPGWLIIGMGINLAHAPEIPDKPTTCLSAEGPLITAEQALLVLQDRFGFYYDLWQKQGFAPIREQWLAHAANLGKPLIARLASTKEEQGVFETLDVDGALLLRTSDGQIRRVLAGDVYFHD